MIFNLAVFCRFLAEVRGRKKTDGRKAVMIMVYSLYGGGAERVAAILASALSENYSVSVVCYEKKTEMYSLREGVNVFFLPRFRGAEKTCGVWKHS